MDAVLHLVSDVSEDSGLIDLFAISARASAEAAAAPPPQASPPDPLSIAPLTTDTSDDIDLDDELANPFARKSRTKSFVIAGAAVLLGIVLLSLGVSALGGDGAAPAKPSAATQLPAEAPIPPPPVVTAEPPPPAPAVASAVPAPPSTGSLAASKPAPRVLQPAAGAKPRAPAPSGPKMIKVQSGGVGL